MKEKEAVQLVRAGVWLIEISVYLRAVQINPAKLAPRARITLAMVGVMIIIDVMFQTIFGLLEPDQKEIEEQ